MNWILFHREGRVGALARARGVWVAYALVAVALLQGATGMAADMVFHVSLGGNDSWTGLTPQPNSARTDGPLRSLAAAQGAVRAQLAAMTHGGKRATIRVRIASGTYVLTAPLLFEPADSGSVGFPVVWESGGGPVLISGGMVLPLASTEVGGQVRLTPPNSNLGQMRGAGQLFVNSRRAVLARHPDVGTYWFVTHPVAVPGEPRGREGQSAFGVTPDADAWLALLTEADQGRAVVNVMQSWSAGRHRFDGTVRGAVVRVKPQALWSFLNFGTSQRFFIENVAAALDAPGEWLWDELGVHYRPLAADRGAPLRAVMPMLDRLVVIRGDFGRGQWVQYLQFHGITFAETRSLTPPEGMFDFQAAVGIGAAIEVDGARHVEFKNCGVTRTGGYGIWFRRAVRESSVVGCELSDLGAGGIKLGEAKQNPGDGSATGANLVSNNRIHHSGKIYPGAVAVWIGQSFDNTVSHNTIFDTSYTGISAGWQWGYGVPSSGRNQIVSNLLYNIGQGQLSDLGGIYTLGPSPGTVIAGNVIRQVSAYPGYGPGAWGIYNDAGTSGVVVDNNVIVGTDSGAYHLNYGRGNVLRGNLFAHGDSAEMLVTRLAPEDKKLEVSNNVLVPSVRAPFSGFATSPSVFFADNLVNSGHVGGAVNLDKCGQGCLPKTLKLETTADPAQVKLSGASPTIDAKMAEVVAKAGAVKVVNALVPQRQVQVKSAGTLGPPLSLELDLESVALGERPVGMKYFPPVDAEAIKVVASSDTPYGRCLRFQDRPDFAHRYDPHAFIRLNHDSGTSVVEFSLRIDSKTDFVHEWRDEAKPYRIGPSLRVGPSGVKVNGLIVAPVEVGQWMHFHIAAPLGAAAGKWRMELRDSLGKTRIVDNLTNKSPSWRALWWAGFISDSVAKSTACVGEARFYSK